MSTTLAMGGRADQIQRTQEAEGGPSPINVGSNERLFSDIGGVALVGLGLKRGGLEGGIMALIGAGLLYRGITGHCEVYKALNMSTATKPDANAAPDIHHGVKIQKTLTINRTPEECYLAWRDFENLPKYFAHLESVKSLGGNQYHWIAKAPMGKVSWDAEIIKEVPNEFISWKSMAGSFIANAGSVRFLPAQNGRGTEMTVEINYEPPGGRIGIAVAKLFGEEPEQQINDDLAHFKQVMETGETAQA